MKKLIIYTNPGHAGIALENDDGSFTRYDFGSALAGGEYQKLSGTFNTIVSIGAMIAVTAFCTYAGNAHAQDYLSNQIVAHSIGVLSACYAIAYMPIKGALLKQNHNDENASVRSSEEAYSFEITNEQRDACINTAEKRRKAFYAIGSSNCSHFVKKIIRQTDIHLPRTLINTPTSLAKQLSQIK